MRKNVFILFSVCAIVPNIFRKKQVSSGKKCVACGFIFSLYSPDSIFCIVHNVFVYFFSDAFFNYLCAFFCYVIFQSIFCSFCFTRVQFFVCILVDFVTCFFCEYFSLFLLFFFVFFAISAGFFFCEYQDAYGNWYPVRITEETKTGEYVGQVMFLLFSIQFVSVDQGILGFVLIH